MRLRSGVNVLLEVKGFEDAQTTAKHQAAGRWIKAVNNAREHGEWLFHVARNPQVLEKELEHLAKLRPGEDSAAGVGRVDVVG